MGAQRGILDRGVPVALFDDQLNRPYTIFMGVSPYLVFMRGSVCE